VKKGGNGYTAYLERSQIRLTNPGVALFIRAVRMQSKNAASNTPECAIMETGTGLAVRYFLMAAGQTAVNKMDLII